MFERLLNWFRSRDEDDDEGPAHGPTLSRSGTFAPQPGTRAAAPRRTSTARTPTAAAPPVRVKPGPAGEIAELGPGKNVLVRDPDGREHSGIHEALLFFEEDAVKTSEETGIDPYNTGKFDRSRNWDKRFR